MKDSDKDMSQLLDDLNEISFKHSLTNPSANFMNLTWAVTALTLIATIATIVAAFK